jgi:hypothetical protein
MSSQTIQAFPPGLLSLFGIKNGGSNPGELSQVIIPQLELLDWYLGQQWITQRLVTADLGAGIGFQPIGGGGANVVPQNQVWFVRQAVTGPDTALGAGNAANFWLARQVTPATLIMKMGSTVTLAATQRDYSAMPDSRPVLLRPGDVLGVYFNTKTYAVAMDWRITFEYVPLLI